jgi:hypothetical protein
MRVASFLNFCSSSLGNFEEDSRGWLRSEKGRRGTKSLDATKTQANSIIRQGR